MNPYFCSLYNCKSLRKLQDYLCIKLKSDFKTLSTELSDTPYKFFKPFEKDGRELFVCTLKIKNIHRRLIKLFNIEISSYLKSGVKKQSHITNAQLHAQSNFFLLLDIKGFYPSITKSKIKKQLITTYQQSSNVSEFIANAVTVPQKKSFGKRALVTGSVLSQYFAYVINKKLFDELNSLSLKEGIVFSVYVDDISFSSKKIISYKFHQKVYTIIKKYGYVVHNGKVFRGKKSIKSNVTGVHISKYGFRLLDKHKEKLKTLLSNEFSTNNEKKIKGLINYAIQVNPKYKKYKLLLEKHGKLIK